MKELPPLKMNLPNAETFKNWIILRVEDVTGMIGERVLWSKTSFHVRGGDKLAIIGPNGSGKTTLVKKIINQEPGINTLILDEPTNFLDTKAVEALESLLKEYEGSVIFVSHDRRFIENIATRILEIRNQEIELFEGTYQQYNQPQKARDTEKDKRLLLETKISEVLSRLSTEPSEELEIEFQKLLKEKRELDTIE
ncbi:ATP-binding cassette domain-containing protein [Aneurinibacillus tyrosinisolvens]|uniref:ATP-binding cassette domain-containing protein n=1 Tax=Aneurinibacillus tyrosinisolvens TaxID=1443435 RepID=UPI000B0FC71B|nr:ATP-binding cassette domain-containing protein [Aneurinibacillus tyrosinisolvens]